MKKYHFHPDKLIIITNDDKIYIEKPHLAKFDLQKPATYPAEHSTEFVYISGYGTRNFNKGDMISFSDEPRPDLDEIIDNIDKLINKKKVRDSLPPAAWDIPEDMKEYKPNSGDGSGSSYSPDNPS